MRAFLGVVVAVRVAAGQPAPAPAPGALRLDQAIRLAETRNERAKIADLDITVAEAGVAKAWVAFLPALVASGNNTLHAGTSPHDTSGAQLQLNQPLIQPSAFPLLSEAKHSLAAQEAQSADDRRQLAFDTAKAFFAVLLAEQVVQAAQRKLDTAKADLNDTEEQVRAQLVSTNDVTRAKISLAGAVRELATDKGNLDQAVVSLEFVVNSRVSQGVQSPADVLAESERPAGGADQIVASSLKRRPDLAAKKLTAVAAHDFAREPRMRWFPTLGLSAVTTWTSDPPMNRNAVDGTLAVTASWAIFDAGSRTADARSRDASATIQDLQAEALARSIDAQVRSAVAALVASQQALAASRDAMDASRKSADETAILYRQGLAKAIELLDANEQRFVAEVNFASAQFSLANAYLALRQAAGLDPLGKDQP